MPESTDTVKTVVGPDLFGYIRKERLEKLLQDLFKQKIKVYVSIMKHWI
jgi:uncharacterized membrane protein